MKTSQAGINLIKHFEGIHDGDLSEAGLQPKLCPAGVWTVGYGHALRVNGVNITFRTPKDDLEKLFPQFMTITLEEAEDLLKRDLERYEQIVKKNIKGKELKQQEFDALVSHTYNTGGSENLFKYIREGDREKIKNWWNSTYITAGGVRLRGLVNRRLAEWNLFDTGKWQ